MIIRRLKLSLGLVAFFALVVLFEACDKDAYDFSTDKLSTASQIDAKLALPLINASLTLDELIPDSDDLNRFLTVDDNGFLTISFQSVLATYDAADFMGAESISGSSLPAIDYQIDPQIIDLGLDKLLGAGAVVHFADPTLKIIIKNYWKIPAQFNFTDFYYYKEATSDPIALTGSITTDLQTIDQPVTQGPGLFALTEISLDKSTSNIDDVLSAMPHHLSFGAHFKSVAENPYNYDLSNVEPNEVSIDISIPLDLSFKNLELKDTMEFGLADGLDTTTIKSIKIRLLTENGFPFGMQTQIYFVDENYVVLDSLFDAELEVTAAQVNSSGKVEKSMHVSNDNDISLNTAKLNNFLNAKYLIPKITFNTVGNGSTDVKLYSTYSFGVKMGALIEAHTDI